MAVRVIHNHALLAAGIRALLTPHASPAPVDPSRQPRPSPGVLRSLLVTDLEQALAYCGGADAVLVVESGLTLRKVQALMGSDIQGCVSAEAGCEELLQAVGTLGSGGTHFCPTTRALLAEALTRPELTAREQRVLELLCEGLDNKSIAGRLCIAPSTVKSHLKSILAKTGQRTRTAIATRAVSQGWVGAGV